MLAVFASTITIQHTSLLVMGGTLTDYGWGLCSLSKFFFFLLFPTISYIQYIFPPFFLMITPVIMMLMYVK